MEMNIFPRSKGVQSARKTLHRSKLRILPTNQQNTILPENPEIIDALKNKKSFENKVEEEPETDEERNEIEANLSKSPSQRVYM